MKSHPPRQPRYPRNEHGLTPGQQTFADLYRAGPEKVRGNALACYRQAFPQAALSTAKVQSSRLLRNPAVETYLQLKRQAAEASADIEETRLLREWRRVAFSDIRALFTKDGQLKPIHTLPDDVAAAIASVEVGVRKGEQGEEPLYVYKIKFWNKLEALKKLGKHHGMFRVPAPVKEESDLQRFLQAIANKPLSTPMGRVQAAIDGTLPDYSEFDGPDE
jgi:phage terminase small subunit